MIRKKKGTYVDIGAFHPTLYSNTYLFYRRGWSGISIDPKPGTQRMFRVFRPRDVFYEIDIGESVRKTYYLFSDSAYNTFDEATARRRQEEGIRLVDMHEVVMSPLRDIVAKEGVRSIDILSIDAEGFDVEILKTHNWSIPTRVIIVEDHTFQVETQEKSVCYRFLTDKGYTLTALCGPSLVFSKKD